MKQDERDRGIVILLSIFIVGLGQAYCGKITRGLSIFITSLILWILAYNINVFQILIIQILTPKSLTPFLQLPQLSSIHILTFSLIIIYILILYIWQIYDAKKIADIMTS